MAVVTITQENFQKEVLESAQPVLLDFFATWCGPCRMVSPIVDEIARETPQVKVGKVDIDEQQALAERYKVMGVPTLMAFKGGQVVGQVVGAQPKGRILELLN